MNRSQRIQQHLNAWHDLNATANSVGDAKQPARLWHWRQAMRAAHPERFANVISKAISLQPQQLGFWGAA